MAANIIFWATAVVLAASLTSVCTQSPRLLIRPSQTTVYATRGGNVSLLCDARAFGPLTANQIAWIGPYPNEAPIGTSGQANRVISVSYNRWMLVRLIILFVDFADAGRYTCTGEIGGQQVSKTINVNVVPRSIALPGVDEGPRRGDVRVVDSRVPIIRPVRDVRYVLKHDPLRLRGSRVKRNVTGQPKETTQADFEEHKSTRPSNDLGRIPEGSGIVDDTLTPTVSYDTWPTVITKTSSMASDQTDNYSGADDFEKKTLYTENSRSVDTTVDAFSATPTSESDVFGSTDSTDDDMKVSRISTIFTMDHTMSSEADDASGEVDFDTMSTSVMSETPSPSPEPSSTETTSTKASSPAPPASTVPTDRSMTSTTKSTSTFVPSPFPASTSTSSTSSTSEGAAVQTDTLATTSFGKYGHIAFALALSLAILLLYTLILLNVIIPRCRKQTQSVKFKNENAVKATGPTSVDVIAMKPLKLESRPNSPEFTTVDLDEKPLGLKQSPPAQDKPNGTPASPSSPSSPDSPSKFVSTFVIGRKPSQTDPTGVYIHEGVAGETIEALPEDKAEPSETPGLDSSNGKDSESLSSNSSSSSSSSSEAKET